MTTTAAANQTLTVANTILAQLGGSRFQAMTGATNLLADASSLTFKLGRFTGLKVTHVRVTLDASDAYRVEFLAVRGSGVKVCHDVDGVHAEELRRVFETTTGLRTSL